VRDELDLVTAEADPPASDPGEAIPEDLEAVSLPPEEFHDEIGRYHTLIDHDRRDGTKARRLRSLYDDRCQLCGDRLASGDGTGYSEVHHVRPLGAPHDGRDEYANMLVLCPTHHADFDNGVLRVDADDHTVEHPYDSRVDGDCLSVAPEHDLDGSALRYHNETICTLR